jgi:hypothetical protein
VFAIPDRGYNQAKFRLVKKAGNDAALSDAEIIPVLGIGALVLARLRVES